MNVRLRRRTAVATLLLMAGTLGCSEILDSSGNLPERATVIVTGSSPVPLRLVMSSRFIGVWNPEASKWDVTLNQADTATVSTFPATRSIEMNETAVFFVRLTNPDDAQTATIEMRVEIDGEEVYRQAATMRDASLEFVYFAD